MSRRRKALYLFLGLGVLLALLAASTIAKVRRGEDLLWIAELWAPAAVLSIGLVTGIEFLTAPAQPGVGLAVPEAIPVAAKAKKSVAKRARTSKSPKK